MDDLIKVLSYYSIQYQEKIMCPFHADKNPSMTINADENRWICYGCGKMGNAFDFHSTYQQMLGNTNGMNVLTTYSKIIHSGGKSKEFVKTIRTVKDASYYRQCLIEAKDYYNGLNYVDWKLENNYQNESLAYMECRGFTNAILTDVGMKYTYDDINYPIIFPICENDIFKGWVCRTFDPFTEHKRKYLYNKGFRRKNCISGSYGSSDCVMLVEGHLDMVRAKQFGIKDVGALLGWHVSKNQIRHLKDSNVKLIICATDNDTKGEDGYTELKKYDKYFKVIRFPFPPNIKDIGQMNKFQFKRAQNKINRVLKKEKLEWV